MSTTHKYGDLALYRRLFIETRPFWPHIGLLLVIGLLSTPLALLTPVPLQITVDSVLGSKPLPGWLEPLVPAAISGNSSHLLFFAGGLLLFIALLTYLNGLIQWLLQVYTNEKLLLGFRAKLFRHLQDLSFSYHDRKGSADSIYRIQYDTYSLQNVATEGLIPLVTGITMLVSMICIMLRIDWLLALVALAVLPLIVVMTNISRNILRERWAILKEHESSAMSVIQETLSALRVVKAFGKEEHESKRFVAQSDKVVKDQMRVAFLGGGFDLCIGVTTAFGTAIVLVLGVYHVQSGIITLGELLLVMAYLAQLYAPLSSISNQVAELQSSLAGAERVFSVLDHEPRVKTKSNAKPLDTAAGAIAFRYVTFSYDDGAPVINNVSFDVPPHARVGIYGPTGAGKTTLVSLMLRFYDPDEGQILLDGTDLKDYSLGDLREQFAMVLQEPILFSASVAENIAYSRPEARKEEIVAAAKAANAHEFIAGLKDGYDTLVGERGMRLSGGERQRISLARAFLKDAPILILDEPTSSVDLKTEAVIVDAMDRLMSGRTTFMIAHRMSTLEHCNLWIRLERGCAAYLETSPPAIIKEVRQVS